MVRSFAFGDRPFTSHAAHGGGLTAADLKRLVREQSLRRLLRGVYVATDVPDSLELRARAVGLVLPPSAVVCDRTAAWVHGVDVLAFWESDLLPPVETVVEPVSTRVRRSGVLGGRRTLTSEDVIDRYGIRVTSPTRTALDLGRKLRRRDGVAAVDALMAAEGLRPDDLAAELPRFRGLRGVVQLRDVIALSDPAAESPGESWLRVCMVDAGLPRPDSQIWVRCDGYDLYRIDLGYEKLLVGAEFDGVADHSSPAQVEHDEQRRAWLHEQGWDIVVVRKDDFTDPRISAWTAELASLIAERRRVGGNRAVRRWRRDVSGTLACGHRAP